MKNNFIPYNPKLRQTARKLRKQGILSEVLLWNELKGKKVLGYDFHRQKPLKNYIVDFYCNELMLAIEIDGSSHHNKQDYDVKRQNELTTEGIRFLRYSDEAVKENVINIKYHSFNHRHYFFLLRGRYYKPQRTAA
jgi:very-short-patch-repair endonuclease